MKQRSDLHMVMTNYFKDFGMPINLICDDSAELINGKVGDFPHQVQLWVLATIPSEPNKRKLSLKTFEPHTRNKKSMN